MDGSLYEMIFKRKSFHLFRNIGNETISEEELKDIENKYSYVYACYLKTWGKLDFKTKSGEYNITTKTHAAFE